MKIPVVISLRNSSINQVQKIYSQIPSFGIYDGPSADDFRVMDEQKGAREEGIKLIDQSVANSTKKLVAALASEKSKPATSTSEVIKVLSEFFDALPDVLTYRNTTPRNQWDRTVNDQLDVSLLKKLIVKNLKNFKK